jgi:hypothetical protein
MLRVDCRKASRLPPSATATAIPRMRWRLSSRAGAPLKPFAMKSPLPCVSTRCSQPGASIPATCPSAKAPPGRPNPKLTSLMRLARSPSSMTLKFSGLNTPQTTGERRASGYPFNAHHLEERDVADRVLDPLLPRAGWEPLDDARHVGPARARPLHRQVETKQLLRAGPISSVLETVLEGPVDHMRCGQQTHRILRGRDQRARPDNDRSIAAPGAGQHARNRLLPHPGHQMPPLLPFAFSTACGLP